MAIYNIFHIYDVDGGFGDAIETEDLIATVEATQDEIDAFVKEWDNPEVYASPYNDLFEHGIAARKVEIVPLSSVIPYERYDSNGKEDEEE